VDLLDSPFITLRQPIDKLGEIEIKKLIRSIEKRESVFSTDSFGYTTYSEKANSTTFFFFLILREEAFL
jgi:hypothetical protein